MLYVGDEDEDVDEEEEHEEEDVDDSLADTSLALVLNRMKSCVSAVTRWFDAARVLIYLIAVGLFLFTLCSLLLLPIDGKSETRVVLVGVRLVLVLLLLLLLASVVAALGYTCMSA